MDKRIKVRLILMFFRTKAEQDCTRAHKKWRETNSGLHLTAVGCSARSLRGNAKKKALGRPSEPRPKPSTVAPISRRSPRLCCTYTHTYPFLRKVVWTRVLRRASQRTRFYLALEKEKIQRAPGAQNGYSFFKEK